MTTFNIERARKYLQQFNFADLFIEELGWEQPAQAKPDQVAVAGETYTRRQVAQLAGVVVFEVTAANGLMPDAKTRAAVQQVVTAQYYENLLIFVDGPRSQSVWYWVKRDNNKRYPRSHYFVTGQTGDLFLSKISAMFVDISELDDDGNLPVVAVAGRMKAALDIERVTKKFFDEFQLAHAQFLGHISGIPDERERRWYTSVILNRIMFIWFLQFKGFIDRGDRQYLSRKLEASRSTAANQYYPRFLQTLFFEGFAKPEEKRDAQTKKLLGEVKYLNGGLFLRHPIEEKYGAAITIPDAAFEELYRLFNRYSWSLDDTIGGRDDEINPDVLGHIFEKYINQKEFGAYYTRPEITEYLCEQTIHKLVLDKLAEANQPVPGLPAPPKFETIGDIYTKLDALRASQLLHHILPQLSLLDPACGSGAFLVAAMRTLVDIYEGVIGRIEFLKDGGLKQWLAEEKKRHPSLPYFIKKRVITQNLYGVDIMAEAVEIARLRLFLALVAAAHTVDDLEPLPNIDFNILPGNSLIGLLRVDPAAFDSHTQTGIGRVTQQEMFGASRAQSYQEIVAEKNRLIRDYQTMAGLTDDLQALRDNILAQRHKANATLNKILLDEFEALGIQFEQATWDAQKNAEGKPKKRALTLADMEALQPFHWGYEFDEVMNERGGFDAIITNPPWEASRPQAKEFFAYYSETVTVNKTTIKEFEKLQKQILQDRQIRQEWEIYLSQFPHTNLYFRNAQQYKNQVPVTDGRKIGTSLNLYKMFLEQTYNLLRDGGVCGLVIPDGIYSELGTMQLRKMLYEQTQIQGMICFENRKNIFEGVDSRFKFVVLTFEKGKKTIQFPTAFMRHDVSELNSFPEQSSLAISVNLIHKMSPDTLTVVEFKDLIDLQIAEKVLRFPLLGEKIEDSWSIKLGREFHMTDDSDLFNTEPKRNYLPLFEGKMIHQFTHNWGGPRYFVDEKQGRARVLGRIEDERQILDYQIYRLTYRKVASSTNERSMIATILPKKVFCGESLTLEKPSQTSSNLSSTARLSLVALLNSFIVDYLIRQKVSVNLIVSQVYQLPVPRLTAADPAFAPIVERAAKLICTTPEFDDLAREVGLGSHKNGITHPAQRAQLRAELDGLIAHIYGLTEAEFSHILSTFPLVDEAVKGAALGEYRKLAPDPAVMALIVGGESAVVEFKVAARRNPVTGKDDGQKMSDNVVKAVAGFMNASGGTVFIGVDDKGAIQGVEVEYEIANKNKANWDGYQLFLEGLLKNKLSLPNAFQFYQITAHTIEGKTICRIQVQPGNVPAYVDNKLYVRTGNQTSELQGRDLVAYVSGDRWK